MKYTYNFDTDKLDVINTESDFSAYFVPYSGANATVNLNSQTLITTGKIIGELAKVQTDEPVPQIGDLWWDSDEVVVESRLLLDQSVVQSVTNGAPNFQNGITLGSGYTSTDAEPWGTSFWDTNNHTVTTVLESGVKLQNGQELHIYAKNITGSTIANGHPVSIVQNVGQFTAIGSVDITSPSAYAFAGLATQPFTTNGFGYVTIRGVVRDIDTSVLDEGKPVYVSPSGGLTKMFPSVPNYIVNVGIVEYKHSQHGRINVFPLVNPKFSDLSDVDGTPLATTGQMAIWNNSNRYFDFNYNIGSYVAKQSELNVNITGSVAFGSGANMTTFTNYGHMITTGSARTWRDELGDITKLKAQGISITDNAAEACTTFANNATTNSFLYTNLQLNHDRDLSSELHPHLHWMQIGSHINAGSITPNWYLAHRWQVNGGSLTTAWTGGAWIGNAFSSPGSIHQITMFPAITPPTGTMISDIVQFKLYRDTNNSTGSFVGADPVATAVDALSFDVHFMTNSLGSDEEYVK